MKTKIRTLFHKIRKADYRHYICACITVLFATLTFTVFPTCFVRLWESLKDLGTSLVFYFTELCELDTVWRPTVNDYSTVPWMPFWGLPETWEEFQILWKRYWEILFTKENLENYFMAVSEALEYASKYILLIGAPLLLVGYQMFRKYLETHNNDYNEDSPALVKAKKLADVTYIPVKKWVLSFVDFMKQHPYHHKTWIFIWCLNFNVIVMLVEFIAFYLYFVVSFDFTNVYRQFYKLFVDISVPLYFIPVVGWIIIGYGVFCRIRQNIAYGNLEHMENMNRGFINERPIVTMVCGTMGKKKTTMLSDMLLSQEVMFRDKALDKLLENDMKFPNFPWINLENFIKACKNKHYIYNLASCRRVIRHVVYLERAATSEREYYSFLKHLRKRFGYRHKNMIFDYDVERYGEYYDDKLRLVPIWETVETYAQLYYLYTLDSPLVYSNYSLRTDTVVNDLGNFPMRDSDFFHRDSRELADVSRYSKISDFDAFRLNRRVFEDNVNKDSFEFGAVGITEVGKERKNNLELQEKKKKDEVTNQKNDGFNDWLKMIRHSATVDNFPFTKVITDEQRPESWGADARDLCEIVHIEESSDTKLAMPFFSLFELFYALVYSRFTKLYREYRFMRSDNTLLFYAFKKLSALIEHRYRRVYNTFGYCVLTVNIESGTQDGEMKKKQYYLCSKKIYSKRFSTDCFSDYFAKKALRSTVGIDDLPEYADVKATFDELKSQNSYFINDLVHRQEKENLTE